MRIRILLADDHKIVREGTRQLLEQSPDMQIVGEANDGIEAVHLAETINPDVVVMDVRLPNLNGIDATRAIIGKCPWIHVLILSAYDDDRYVFPLLEAGANGYLLKTSSGMELIEAIRTVQNGGTALSPRIAGKVSHHVDGPKPYQAKSTEGELTEREMDVLRAAANGNSNKSIADLLSISPQTVSVHLRNIFEKLGVNSRSEAAAYAIAHGWITFEVNDD